jgi:hypothetical protein
MFGGEGGWHKLCQSARGTRGAARPGAAATTYHGRQAEARPGAQLGTGEKGRRGRGEGGRHPYALHPAT